jgi:SAM-dependent methyltransferase
MPIRGVKNWWKTHFDRLSLSGYGLPKKTEREVQAAERLLGLRKPSDILDLGCGAGRHALGLAALGHHVVGLDWSETLLESARTAALNMARTDGRAIFIRGDMRRLTMKSRFDAVVNLFTSFGYFETEAEDLAVLRGVRRILRPKGRFLIDLLNKQWLLRHFTPTFWQKSADGDVLRAFNRLSFDAASSRLSNHRTLYLTGGRRRKTFLRFKVYALEDMERLLSASGLRVRKVWGGFDGRPYGQDTFRLIIAASR